MRRVLKIALASAAIGLAAAAMPAEAQTFSGTACSTTNGYISPTASACVGYYDKNLLDSSTQTEQRNAINALLGTSAGISSGLTAPAAIDWNAIVAAGNTFTQTALSGNTFNFGSTLTGWQIIGLHFGNNSDTNSPPADVTAFYLFNFGAGGATGLTFSPNANGFSNGAIYTPHGAVPEAATWAMMLLGFGGIGMAMRRSRHRTGALMQVA
jgi:hypothetical protein